MKPLLFAALMFAVCSTAYSRIGENRKQIVERLGEPVGYPQKGEGTIHHKNGYLIIVGYYRGIVEKISYIRQKTAADDATPMGVDEIAVLLRNNSSEPFERINDTLQTPSLVAHYDKANHILTITSKSRDERLKGNPTKDAAGL